MGLPSPGLSAYSCAFEVKKNEKKKEEAYVASINGGGWKGC